LITDIIEVIEDFFFIFTGGGFNGFLNILSLGLNTLNGSLNGLFLFFNSGNSILKGFFSEFSLVLVKEFNGVIELGSHTGVSGIIF